MDRISEGVFISGFKDLQAKVYATNTCKGFHLTDDAVDTLSEKYGVPESLVKEIHGARVAQKIAADSR